MTYVSVSRLRVESELAGELVEAFRRRARLVDDFDGFERIEVWQSDADPTEVLMVSHWRDRASFKAYMRSEAHRISHDRIPAHVESAIALEKLEHLHAYEVVAE